MRQVLLRLSALLSVAPEIVGADLNHVRIDLDGGPRVREAPFRLVVPAGA